MRFGSEAFQQRRREPRLADTGLAREQHHLAFAGLCLRPAPQQQFEFFFTPDEVGQAVRVQRLEAAFRRTRPQRRPSPYRPGDALEVLGPEVLKLEQIAEKSSGAFGDDDHVRLGDPLQPCRKVRRLADDAALLRFARSDQVADDNKARGNSDTCLQGNARLQRGDCRDYFQPGPHGPLGVVLMRLRIAEVDQDAVAHVFRHEAVEAAHGLGDAFLIGRNDFAQVLGVHAGRERRRTDKVREHHRDLAAFGGVPRGRVCCRRIGGAVGLRLHHHAARQWRRGVCGGARVADAKLLQVLLPSSSAGPFRQSRSRGMPPHTVRGQGSAANLRGP